MIIELKLLRRWHKRWDLIVFIDQHSSSSVQTGRSELIAAIELRNPFLKLFVIINDCVHPLIFLYGNGKGFKVVWERRFDKIIVPFVQVVVRKISFSMLITQNESTDDSSIIRLTSLPLHPCVSVSCDVDVSSTDDEQWRVCQYLRQIQLPN
jgi:hypothetical protein